MLSSRAPNLLFSAKSRNTRNSGSINVLPAYIPALFRYLQTYYQQHQLFLSLRKEMTLYDNQVGGHMDQIFICEESRNILKPCRQLEVEFYELLQTSLQQLLPYTPKYYGTIPFPLPMNAETPPDTPPPSSSNGNISSIPSLKSIMSGNNGTTKTISLENLTLPFVNPCICDIKIGTRLYSDDADTAKRGRMIYQANTTTSADTGLRICGVKIDDTVTVVKHGKELGRSLTKNTIHKGFQAYFTNSNGQLVLPSVLNAIVNKMDHLIDAVENSKGIRLYASSVLIIYEGKTGWSSSTTTATTSADENAKESTPLVDVRLIDFAHSHYYPEDDQADNGALLGLRNIRNNIRNLFLQP